MEETNIISERLAALSDFLTDEGFYPECYENGFVSFFYYGGRYLHTSRRRRKGHLYASP